MKEWTSRAKHAEFGYCINSDCENQTFVDGRESLLCVCTIVEKSRVVDEGDKEEGSSTRSQRAREEVIQGKVKNSEYLNNYGNSSQAPRNQSQSVSRHVRKFQFGR